MLPDRNGAGAGRTAIVLSGGGAIAAAAYRRGGTSHSRGLLPRLLARSALHGVPEEEADLFSYLYFDAGFTRPLIELGRSDAKRQAEEIFRLLAGS